MSSWKESRCPRNRVIESCFRDKSNKSSGLRVWRFAPQRGGCYKNVIPSTAEKVQYQGGIAPRISRKDVCEAREKVAAAPTAP